MKQYVMQVKNLCKTFTSVRGADPISILKNVDLNVKYGETVGIVGSSGCGKTTLLQILGQVDRPDSGQLIFDGCDCSNLSDEEKSKVLATKVSFVHQFHHLLPEFTAIENVIISCLIPGMEQPVAHKTATTILNNLGLSGKENNMPSELSGGERQRVAIARAIAKKPKIILADEPTGNLDPENGQIIFDTLIKLVKSQGLSLICVTHSMELAKSLDRCVTLQKGGVIPVKV